MLDHHVIIPLSWSSIIIINTSTHHTIRSCIVLTTSTNVESPITYHSQGVNHLSFMYVGFCNVSVMCCVMRVVIIHHHHHNQQAHEHSINLMISFITNLYKCYQDAESLSVLYNALLFPCCVILLCESVVIIPLSWIIHHHHQYNQHQPN